MTKYYETQKHLFTITPDTSSATYQICLTNKITKRSYYPKKNPEMCSDDESNTHIRYINTITKIKVVETTGKINHNKKHFTAFVTIHCIDTSNMVTIRRFQLHNKKNLIF